MEPFQTRETGESSKGQTSEQHPLIEKEEVFDNSNDTLMKYLGTQFKAVRSKHYGENRSETKLKRESLLFSSEKLALNLFTRDLQKSYLIGHDNENDFEGSQPEEANHLMKEISDLSLDHINSDTTAVRLQGMHLVKELSKVKPQLRIKEKLLKICIGSIFALLPLDILKKQSGDTNNIEALYHKNMDALEETLRHLLSERPNTTQLLVLIDHVSPWMTSPQEYERARAVNTYVFLLECAATNSSFCVSDEGVEFPHLGFMIGQLCLRLYEPDMGIGNRAMEGIYVLYFLMRRQQDSEMTTDYLDSELHEIYRETLGPYLPSSPGDNIIHIVKEFEPYLTSKQMTQLLLTAVGCLKQSNKNSIVASHAITRLILEQYKYKLQEQVPEIVDKIYMHLSTTYQFQGRQNMLKVVSVLAQTYMKDVCDALLRCPLPIDRYSTEMWHVMTKTFSEDELIALVHVLLNRLQMNPKITGNYITPLAASSVFCKLFSVPRCADVALFIYPRLLMTLLVQVHYNIKHDVIWTMIPEECEPVRYHVKTLKTLFLAVRAYIEFAFLENEGEMLSSCEDHHRGVGLLARSMLENCSCDLLRILYLLVPFLERGDEEHQITALAFFVELLIMPEAKRIPEKYSLNRLKQGLSNENAIIRALCIKGLVNMADWPKKDIKVLLPTMTKGLSHMDGRLFVETVVDIERILTSPEGADCIGDISLSLQEHFCNEKETVRASAIYLFGKMVKLAKKSNTATMKGQALDSLVPLLLHLQEENSDITKNCKFTLDECMNILGWKLPKQVVSEKAWYEHEDVLDETCKYLVKKQEGNLQKFLYQGLYYSESKLLAVKRASIMFLGFLVLHMDRRAQRLDLTLVGRALESLMHDKEETVCVAAAHAHERICAVLSKQPNSSNGGSSTATGNTNDKSARNSRSSVAVRNTSSSHLFGILGLWKAGAGK